MGPCSNASFGVPVVHPANDRAKCTLTLLSRRESISGDISPLLRVDDFCCSLNARSSLRKQDENILEVDTLFNRTDATRARHRTSSGAATQPSENVRPTSMIKCRVYLALILFHTTFHRCQTATYRHLFSIFLSFLTRQRLVCYSCFRRAAYADIVLARDCKGEIDIESVEGHAV